VTPKHEKLATSAQTVDELKKGSVNLANRNIYPALRKILSHRLLANNISGEFNMELDSNG